MVKMNEIWKDIFGYEGYYQVSNTGKVKNVNTNHIKHSTLANTGYLVITLYKDNKGKTLTIHRLVAQAFIPNPDNKPQVNHIDGNKTNNNITNLEWVTAKENIRHIIGLGFKPVCNTRGKFGKDNKRSTKIGQYSKNGKLLNIYYGGNEIKKKLNLSTATNILEVVKGKRKTAFGYVWKEMR